MKAENKIFIKSFLLSGVVYAGLMAGYNYVDGQEFNIWKFLFHFLVFGLFMGLISRYSHKRQIEKELEETRIKKTEYKTE